MKETEKLRVKTNELQSKIAKLIGEFFDENGFCMLDIEIINKSIELEDKGHTINTEIKVTVKI